MTLLHQAAQKAVEARMCPFCGTTPGPLLFTRFSASMALVCNCCGARGPLEDTEPEAAAAWNRSQESALQQQPEPVAPEGYELVMVPKLQPADEPDWDECIRQAEVATGLKVERHTMSIVIREIRRWLAGRKSAPPALQQQQVPASVRDAHGNIVLHNGREVCYRDEAPSTASQQEVPREPVAWVPYCHTDCHNGIEGEYRWDEVSEKPFEMADPAHWECRRLYASPSTTRQQEAGSEDEWKNEAASVLARFISLSVQPPAEEWARTASAAIRLLNDPAGLPAASSTPENAGGVATPRAVNPPEFQEATWGVDSVMRPCKGMAISEYAFQQWAKDVGIVLSDPQPKAPVRLVEGPPRDFGQAQDRYGEHMDRPDPQPKAPSGTGGGEHGA